MPTKPSQEKPKSLVLFPRLCRFDAEVGVTTSVNDIEHIESQSLVRRRRHPHLLLPGRQDRGGRRPGDGHQPGDSEGHAAGHQSAVHRAVQRHERADRADRRQQRHADRAADLRLCLELHHPAARHRPGRARAAALGRQMAAGDGRSRPRSALRPRPLAAGRPDGHQQPEPDHPGRNGQDRRHGILRQAQQQPAS